MSKKTKDEPETPVVKETIQAKHTFTQDERNELGMELSRTCRAIGTMEEEKAATAKDYAGRIQIAEIKRDSLVEKIASGYEMRSTECAVTFYPTNRSKDYWRLNLDGTRGEFIERREMTTSDFQLTIPDGEPKEEK